MPLKVPEHRARLHELRQEHCLTQEQAAVAIGISRDTYARIEAGGPAAIRSRRKIAAYFRAPVRELFPELFQTPATSC